MTNARIDPSSIRRPRERTGVAKARVVRDHELARYLSSVAKSIDMARRRVGSVTTFPAHVYSHKDRYRFVVVDLLDGGTLASVSPSVFADLIAGERERGSRRYVRAGVFRVADVERFDPARVVLNRRERELIAAYRRGESLSVGERRVNALSRAKVQIKRDDRVCRYCMVRDCETVDHVVPKSRGGEDTWLNLVGCCRKCNEYKADRTPKEAGMLLTIPPRWFGGDELRNVYLKGSGPGMK